MIKHRGDYQNGCLIQARTRGIPAGLIAHKWYVIYDTKDYDNASGFVVEISLNPGTLKTYDPGYFRSLIIDKECIDLWALLYEQN